MAGDASLRDGAEPLQFLRLFCAFLWLNSNASPRFDFLLKTRQNPQNLSLANWSAAANIASCFRSFLMKSVLQSFRLWILLSNWSYWRSSR